MPVRHLLLDADGVLQRLPGGWVAAITAWVGGDAEDLLDETIEAEQPCLVGEGDFASLLAGIVARRGHDLDPAALYRDVWLRVELDPVSMEMARAAKAAGLGVHLASTQESGRAAMMREHYAGELDRLFFSCDLRAGKTDERFFDHVLGVLGAEPDDVAFVDDTAANVATARAVGLRGVHWHLDEGHDVLRSRLAEAGVALPGQTS